MSANLLSNLATTAGAAMSALVFAMIWAKVCRPIPPLDEARARFLLEEQFPGRRIDMVWVGASGKGAVGKSGGLALVLCAVGEAYVGRQIPWAMAASKGLRNGEICVDLTDLALPPAVISLPAWSPHRRAA